MACGPEAWPSPGVYLPLSLPYPCFASRIKGLCLFMSAVFLSSLPVPRSTFFLNFAPSLFAVCRGAFSGLCSPKLAAPTVRYADVRFI